MFKNAKIYLLHQEVGLLIHQGVSVALFKSEQGEHTVVALCLTTHIIPVIRPESFVHVS